MYFHYDPDEWEFIYSSRPCTTCDGDFRKCNGMCNGMVAMGQRHRSLEEIMRIKEDRMKSLCGPKYLRGIREPCDGSCCGLGKDGKPDPELTERVNKRTDAWRRIIERGTQWLGFGV